MFSQNTDKTKTARMISTAIQSIHKINHWSQKFCTFCVVFCICIIKPVQNLNGRWKGVIGFLFQQSCFATFELDRTVQPLQRLENVMWVKESMHGRYKKPFVGYQVKKASILGYWSSLATLSWADARLPPRIEIKDNKICIFFRTLSRHLRLVVG